MIVDLIKKFFKLSKDSIQKKIFLTSNRDYIHLKII